MKKLNDMKTRLLVRMFCKIAKSRGLELEAVVDTKCYFATPHHSWERGSNENANGLIRQYLPKRRSMAGLTQRECQRIADKLNRRPRKRLGFRTPEEIYAA